MAVDPAIAHLVRRAGFGYSPAEGEMLDQMSVPALVDALVDYESVPDTVDDNIGVPGFLGITTRGPCGAVGRRLLRHRLRHA